MSFGAIDNPLRKLLAGISKNGRNFLELWDEGLAKLRPEDRAAVESRLLDEMCMEQTRAPRIAIIGKTGVGKSSTINALFGTSLDVSHVTAGTLKPHELAIESQAVGNRLGGKNVAGSAGDIILYDMPGLGEDIDKDEEYRRVYAEVIAQSDVAVWVIAAHERALATDQVMIRDVVLAADAAIVSRLVVALNQVDLIQPGQWNTRANIPSRAQRESIRVKIADVQAKLVKVVPGLRVEQIVPYAAKRHYHLPQLFNAMMTACPKDRAWVLHSREAVADFFDFVDPEIRDLLARTEAK